MTGPDVPAPDVRSTTGTDFGVALLAALDQFVDSGKIARFWLRDDDAVAPTAALDQLLALCVAHAVPLTLAVIPEPTGPALAERLRIHPDGVARVSVAVHGWSHANHAKAPGKKRELGPDRPREVVLADLARGFEKLSALHGTRLQPVLVPPWNRIDARLLPHVPAIGFRAVSVYGPEKVRPETGGPKEGALPFVNTHVDVIDWHGTRGCRDGITLETEIVARLQTCFATGASVGLLTHHLVHDEAVWVFLKDLFRITARHPACRWVGIADLVDDPATQNR